MWFILKYKVLYKFASEGNLYCFKDVETFFTGQKKLRKLFLQCLVLLMVLSIQCQMWDIST